jgi:YHS domain-containing protein
MLRTWKWISASLVLVAASSLLLPGCGQTEKKAEEKKTPRAEKKNDAHGHPPGAHGGIIVEVGRDNYHAEAVFEKGTLRLFTLGNDEAKVIDVEKQTLKAFVKAEAGGDAVEMALEPTPQTGDKPGRTSQFVGKLPAEFAGKAVSVTIPALAIDGERFRIGFSSTPPKHDPPMPAGAKLDEEKELYLKPGGKYTEADIRANGRTTPTEKFKGIASNHDLKTMPGDKICPITLTKANPQFTWVVGGRTYEFCCPPCVDEFVSTAKSNPDLIKMPEDYVKRK